MFQFIPQCVAGIGEVPGSSLYEEAILYLPMKQKSVKYFILPVLRNPGILSNSIKIFSLIVRCFIVRVPKYIFMFQISNLKYAINIKYENMQLISNMQFQISNYLCNTLCSALSEHLSAGDLLGQSS